MSRLVSSPSKKRWDKSEKFHTFNRHGVFQQSLWGAPLTSNPVPGRYKSMHKHTHTYWRPHKNNSKKPGAWFKNTLQIQKYNTITAIIIIFQSCLQWISIGMVRIFWLATSVVHQLCNPASCGSIIIHNFGIKNTSCGDAKMCLSLQE